MYGISMPHNFFSCQFHTIWFCWNMEKSLRKFWSIKLYKIHRRRYGHMCSVSFCLLQFRRNGSATLNAFTSISSNTATVVICCIWRSHSVVSFSRFHCLARRFDDNSPIPIPMDYTLWNCQSAPVPTASFTLNIRWFYYILACV